MKSFIVKYLKYFFSVFGIGILYCFGFLILRETHPFSRFPMYSSFPNWSYLFYISDKNGELIPTEQFSADAGSIAHFFYSYNHANGLICGNFLETQEELEITGKAMITNYVDSVMQKKLNIDSISIHRIGFMYKNDSIELIDDLMYERGY